MKNLTLTKALVSILILSLFAPLKAQNSSATEKYRVIAYQQGNTQIQSMSNEVEIIPAAVIYIPNAFTPNGDGLNDSFGGMGEGITDYNMQIFDRWGNLLFESNNIDVQWDGNYKNEIVPMGVYVFKLSAKGPGSNGKSKKLIRKTGSVTVAI